MLDNNAIYCDSFGVEHVSKNNQCKQTYLEYKHIIQSCVDIIALDLLTICLQEKLKLTILVCFRLMI